MNRDDIVIIRWASPQTVRLLALPFDLLRGNFAAIHEVREKPKVKFYKQGTMNTHRPDNLICEIKFGSHLYGTSTENSDEDFKGIFLPSIEEILLGRIPKTAASTPRNDDRKNEPGELDCEYYSLHHFLRLATQGQTVAIDMLFAPENLVWKSPEFGWIWDEIQKDRHLLVSKQMNAFVGYARGQAAKYSLKGERLNKLNAFVKTLDGCVEEDPIGDYWDLLPRDDERVNPQGIRELQIGGKWFGETTSVRTVDWSVRLTVQKYGKRAHAAADASGVDWKALSHAARVSKELIELLTFGRVNFPLADAPLLLDIKLGKIPLEEVQNILDRDLAFVELQARQSHLPEKVNCKYWDTFLKKVLSNYLYGVFLLEGISPQGEYTYDRTSPAEHSPGSKQP